MARALPSAMRLVTRCFSCEVAFQRAKASLVLSLLEAYEACADAAVATALAQRITDLMAARPRLDLSAASFEDGYKVRTRTPD